MVQTLFFPSIVFLFLFFPLQEDSSFLPEGQAELEDFKFPDLILCVATQSVRSALHCFRLWSCFSERINIPETLKSESKHWTWLHSDLRLKDTRLISRYRSYAWAVELLILSVSRWCDFFSHTFLFFPHERLLVTCQVTNEWNLMEKIKSAEWRVNWRHLMQDLDDISEWKVMLATDLRGWWGEVEDGGSDWESRGSTCRISLASQEDFQWAVSTKTCQVLLLICWSLASIFPGFSGCPHSGVAGAHCFKMRQDTSCHSVS